MYALGFTLGFVHGALAFYAARVIVRIRNRREPQ